MALHALRWPAQSGRGLSQQALATCGYKTLPPSYPHKLVPLSLPRITEKLSARDSSRKQGALKHGWHHGRGELDAL